MKSCDFASTFARCLLGVALKRCEIAYLNASQNSCVAELSRIVDIFGGALLADPVGSGKTRIAIALASQKSTVGLQRICVIGPARIRNHWIQEAKKCGGVEVEFYSHTFLSQNNNIEPSSDFIIVDEAHRFRNSKAKRSIQLKRILDSRICLLVSATPFVNAQSDLITLVRYFLDDDDARSQLGIDPEKATQADLKSLLFSLCVRRGYTDVPELSAHEIPYELSSEEIDFIHTFSAAIDVLHFEALKWEWPAGLVRHFLLKQFHCGLPALFSSLNSITRYCEEWLSAAEKNVGMNRHFFSKAFPNGQLPLTFMYPQLRQGESEKVKADVKILKALVSSLKNMKQDTHHEATLNLCRRNKKTLIFTSRIDVAESLFKRFLGGNTRVGMIHSKRALVSGIGDADPTEIVSKFRNESLLERHKISTLIATDCLSEGISFPECSSVIFMDLPDTAVKIEQRIGRVVRLNSVSERSRVYRLCPSNHPDLKNSRSGFAQTKSERSSELGFRYALASELLGNENTPEDPFSALLECRNILEDLDVEDVCVSESNRYFLLEGFFELSSLTLVRFLEQGAIFSHHWVAFRNGRLITRWSEIRDTVLTLAKSEYRGKVDPHAALPVEERKHFDGLISRRNLTRFRPTSKQTADSISRRLEAKISNFALSSEEFEHLRRILYSPLSRGRRLRFDAILRKENAVALHDLLRMKTVRVSKLAYEVVFRIQLGNS